jgi:hypothetical protein
MSEKQRQTFEVGQRQAQRREQMLSEEVRSLRMEGERQRELMAQYTEFIRDKSDEVINSIEDAHDEKMYVCHFVSLIIHPLHYKCIPL